MTKITSSEGEEMLLFQSGFCPLSTYFPCNFQNNGTRYRSAEQHYQSCKAKHFGDLTAYKMIMATWSPKTQSDIASTIDGFNEKGWEKKATAVMERGLRLKFEQDDISRQYLLDTGDAILVFTSKLQPYWGNGMSMNDKGNSDKKLWAGKNMLGELLMKVRADLRMVN